MSRRGHRRVSDLSPEEQAEYQAGIRQSKNARKGKRRSIPAQMDHASGKRKQARQDEQRIKRQRGETGGR